MQELARVFRASDPIVLCGESISLKETELADLAELLLESLLNKDDWYSDGKRSFTDEPFTLIDVNVLSFGLAPWA